MHNLTASSERLCEIADLVSSNIPSYKQLKPLDAFRRICKANRIHITNHHLISRGFIMSIDGRWTIALGAGLIEQHAEFVAFHELGHYFLRHRNDKASNEIDANLFSYLSLKQMEVEA